jgi:hypothetical protein
MPCNNLGEVVGERQNFVGDGNHAGNFAAGTRVDVRIRWVHYHDSMIETFQAPPKALDHDFISTR